MQTNTHDEVSSTLQKFQVGYTARDVTKLDEFVQLFVQDESIEMIGIGASKRAANEWSSLRISINISAIGCKLDEKNEAVAIKGDIS